MVISDYFYSNDILFLFYISLKLYLIYNVIKIYRGTNTDIILDQHLCIYHATIHV